MGTTSYFEQPVTAIDDDGQGLASHQHVVTIGVGMFTGREELYLSIVDRHSDEHCAPAVQLDKNTARVLLDSLQQAMRHLRYLE